MICHQAQIYESHGLGFLIPPSGRFQFTIPAEKQRFSVSTAQRKKILAKIADFPVALREP